MILSDDLFTAAHDLGHLLARQPAIIAYRAAVAALAADPDAASLDRHFEAVRTDLVTRQRSGDDLPVEEVGQFHHLREKVLANALIEARDSARNEAQRFLDTVTHELSGRLGLSYTSFVATEQNK